ncbi:ashwin-like [Xyrauchen texanus]|uniref:ashwin-like n=1 Tax=Xyrauchen texanus TaxID=154827 RepID=UPI002241B153|nr:ashwin-like [Xyrauchen texanus]
MKNMASHREDRTGNPRSNAGDISKIDLLLHPELLSHGFIQLVLHERGLTVDDAVDRDRLTDLYLRHVIPLPQRDLPNTRWGKRMERTRARQSSTSAHSSGSDIGRKRPLIVFDVSSTNTGNVKLKKPDTSLAPVATDRLKPPVSSVSLSNPIRKLSGSSSNGSSNSSSNSYNRTPVSELRASSKSPSVTCNNSNTADFLVHSNNTASKLKRTAPSDGEPHTAKDIKSPDIKKKIQHVTWP